MLLVLHLQMFQATDTLVTLSTGTRQRSQLLSLESLPRRQSAWVRSSLTLT